MEFKSKIVQDLYNINEHAKQKAGKKNTGTAVTQKIHPIQDRSNQDSYANTTESSDSTSAFTQTYGDQAPHSESPTEFAEFTNTHPYSDVFDRAMNEQGLSVGEIQTEEDWRLGMQSATEFQSAEQPATKMGLFSKIAARPGRSILIGALGLGSIVMIIMSIMIGTGRI